MLSRRVCLSGLLSILAVPAAWAQGYGRERNERGDHRNERYEISVTNNWDRPADVSIIADRRDELVRENWTIAPRANSWLAHSDHRRVRVRGSDRIKVRHDMRAVRIAEVARFQDGHWQLSVRDVVQAQRNRD